MPTEGGLGSLAAAKGVVHRRSAAGASAAMLYASRRRRPPAFLLSLRTLLAPPLPSQTDVALIVPRSSFLAEEWRWILAGLGPSALALIRSTPHVNFLLFPSFLGYVVKNILPDDLGGRQRCNW